MIKKLAVSLACLVMVLQLCMIQAFAEVNGTSAAQAPELKAESAILLDQKTGKVLFDKDSHKKMYPASITKVLTALIAMENIKMDEVVTVGREINLTELDSSISGLKVGEKITGQDLIWAMMLPSGNDAAYVAAVTVARKLNGDSSLSIENSVAAFVELMNKRAQELGAKESHFANPDGYHLDDHYSTANDLAIIAQAALKNEFFRKVVSTYSYKITDVKTLQTAVKDVPTEWTNKNLMLNKNSKYYYQYATGIKTGHTSLAGYCLSSAAEKDGMSLVSVVLKDSTEADRWIDTKTLFEYGFNNFKYYTLLKKGDPATTVKAVRKYLNDEIELNAIISKDATDILSASQYGSLKKTFEWDSALVKDAAAGSNEVKLKAPIKAGQVLGKIIYSIDGIAIAEAELTADKTSNKGNFSDALYSLIAFADKFKFIIIGVLVVIIAAVIFVVRNRVR